MTIVLSPAPTTGEVVSWIDADDVEHVFDRVTGYRVLYGRAGAWMPPIGLTEDPLPFDSGSRLRQVRVNARTMDLPMLIKGSNQTELVDRLRQIMRWVDPTRGDGYLRVTRDTAARQIACRYASGLQLEEGLDQVNPSNGWQRAMLSLRAVEPYWQDVDAISVSSALDDAPVPWFGRPWFGGPWFGASTVFRRFTVNNDGDAEAWPVWDVLGPGSDPVLRNISTGKEIAASLTLFAGEHLMIDTRPNVKTVNDGLGSNLFSTLSATSELWSLGTGFQTVELSFSATTADSLVGLSYNRRFWGP